MDLNFGAFDCDRLLFAVYSQLFRTALALRSRIGVLISPPQKFKGEYKLWLQWFLATFG